MSDNDSTTRSHATVNHCAKSTASPSVCSPPWCPHREQSFCSLWSQLVVVFPRCTLYVYPCRACRWTGRDVRPTALNPFCSRLSLPSCVSAEPSSRWADAWTSVTGLTSIAISACLSVLLSVLTARGRRLPLRWWLLVLRPLTIVPVWAPLHVLIRQPDRPRSPLVRRHDSEAVTESMR